MSDQSAAREAIGVIGAIARHHAGLPDSFQVLGLPNVSLTLGHCRALAAMATALEGAAAAHAQLPGQAPATAVPAPPDVGADTDC